MSRKEALGTPYSVATDIFFAHRADCNWHYLQQATKQINKSIKVNKVPYSLQRCVES